MGCVTNPTNSREASRHVTSSSAYGRPVSLWSGQLDITENSFWGKLNASSGQACHQDNCQNHTFPWPGRRRDARDVTSSSPSCLCCLTSGIMPGTLTSSLWPCIGQTVFRWLRDWPAIGQNDHTISIDSRMITVAKCPANMMRSWCGPIDRYSRHYSGHCLVSVFDSQDKCVWTSSYTADNDVAHSLPWVIHYQTKTKIELWWWCKKWQCDSVCCCGRF